MTAPEGNDYAKGNPGGDGAPEGNDFAVGNAGGKGGPPGNQKATTHGVYSDQPFALFETFSPEEKERIAVLTQKYIDLAPFDKDDPRAERIFMVVMMQWQEAQARSRVIDADLSETKVIGVTDDGEAITDTREHHLSKEANRLNQSIRLQLKELGFIGPHLSDRPGDEATGQSLAQWLSSAVLDDGDDSDDGERSALDVADE